MKLRNCLVIAAIAICLASATGSASPPIENTATAPPFTAIAASHPAFQEGVPDSIAYIPPSAPAAVCGAKCDVLSQIATGTVVSIVVCEPARLALAIPITARAAMNQDADGANVQGRGEVDGFAAQHAGNVTA
jgi:hypothetical protein